MQQSTADNIQHAMHLLNTNNTLL